MTIYTPTGIISHGSAVAVVVSTTIAGPLQVVKGVLSVVGTTATIPVSNVEIVQNLLDVIPDTPAEVPLTDPAWLSLYSFVGNLVQQKA